MFYKNIFLLRQIIFLTFSLLFFSNTLTGQSIFHELAHYWHFNSPINKPWEVKADHSVTQNAIITYEGEGDGYMDRVDDGSPLSLRNGAESGYALRVRNPSIDRDLVFDVPTSGFDNIVFSYDVKRSSNGVRNQQLFYRTSKAGEWVKFEDDILITTEYQAYSFDFSGINGVADNAEFAIKIRFTDAFAYGIAGNSRFDNVSLEGASLSSKNDRDIEINEKNPEIIHYWHFNSLPLRYFMAAETNYSVYDRAYLSYPGIGEGYMDRTTDGSAYNRHMDTPPGHALRVRNPSNDRELIFLMPTTGFKDIVFRYAAKRTSNGATNQQLYYRTVKGGGWIQYTDSIKITEDYQLFTFSFSHLDDVSNNPGFAVKITFTGEYTLGTSGNNRFDNISLEGISTPVTLDVLVTGESKLYQNYPNPFNRTTTIPFYMERAGHATIDVFNIKGKHVAQLVDDHKEYGSHKVYFDANDLPGGLYFYRFKSDSRILNKQMVIVR